MKNASNLNKDATKVASIFNSIAGHYDFLNRILSAGIDKGWRRTLSKMLIKKSNTMTLLDIATGTGDQIISLCKKHPSIISANGIDLAENMLSVGLKKIKQRGLTGKIKLSKGDASDMIFKDNSFDIVSCSFGIRNIDNLNKALEEILRVLKPNGQLLILEFSLPNNSVLRRIYLTYFRHILPAIGQLFSKHPDAYSYLNKSVEDFPYGPKFTGILSAAGFVNITYKIQTFGIATVYSAFKPV